MDEEITDDMLFVAAGRRPNVAGLDLDTAGVIHGDGGIPVDRAMRTSVRHIHAAGDVTGAAQFTHFAGWQGFQAARAALLPGGGATADNVPRITFTDPEIAHIGPTLAEARARWGEGVVSRRSEIADTDRAAADHEEDGFVRLIVRPDGRIAAATVVAPHAGETLGELALAVEHGIDMKALAGTLHAYPTYATGLQRQAVDIALERSLSGLSGRIARWLAGAREPKTPAADDSSPPSHSTPGTSS